MEHSIYLSGIKNALKSKGLTYSDLAKSLSMTESGVKKMLNTKDISFRRILQICEALKVLPGQLFSISENSSIPTIELTTCQEAALLVNRPLLKVYWYFVIERLSPKEIAHTNGESETEVKKQLQKLVTLDLIRQSRGKFLIKGPNKFRWPDDSRLTRLLNQEWSQSTVKKAIKANRGNHRFVALKLSDDNYRNFLGRLSGLFDEMVQISERESLTSAPKRLKDVTAVFAAVDQGVFSTS